MDFDDDERFFGEVIEDALDKMENAERQETDDGDTAFHHVNLDEHEAHALRTHLLLGGHVHDGEVPSKMGATFALMSLSASILEELDEIDEQAGEMYDDLKEQTNFEELPSEEKEETAAEIAEQVELFRRSSRASKLFYEVIVFYMIAGSLIERYTIDLLYQELINEEYVGDSDAETWVEDRMNQKRRESVLKLTGTTTEDLTSQMGRVRKTRNELAHNLEEQLLLDRFDDMSGEIKATVGTLNRLHERVNGYTLLDVSEE